MKTANLAIVFTDIKGFTERTSRQTLEENQHLLRVHEALLAPLFRAFGGRIIKSIGDAFLVTFESPTQAVLSGIAIQDRLWQHNRSLPEDEQIHVRVAVNVGEVRLESNDIFGEPVNIAARVEGITEADEVYFTEAVYLSMNKAEVPAQEVGAFELKGIPGKIRVFRVPHAPYRVEAPAPDAVVSPQEEAALPPFGNLALARVPDAAARGPGVGTPTAQEATAAARVGQGMVTGAARVGQGMVVGATKVGQRAQVLGQRAHVLGGAFLRGMRESFLRLSPEQRRQLVMGFGLVGVLLGLGLGFWMWKTPLRTIAAVEGTTGAEKTARLAEARRVIKEEPDPGRRFFLNGRLEEALGNPGGAVGQYALAARKGDSDAESRIISLLGHEACGVRVSAAETAASLKLVAARGRLESLAEAGGADDGRSSGLFNLSTCDSKRAATNALKRLAQN